MTLAFGNRGSEPPDQANRMPLAIFDGKTIFFAHVPKAGGTSVEDYLIRRFGALSIRGHGRNGSRHDLIQSASHIAAQDLELLLPKKLDLCFAVVRDPVTRILSEYEFQRGVSKTSSLSFSTWLRLVTQAARNEPRIYENHIRPQSDLVPKDAEYFRLEDGFSALISRIDEVVGSEAPEIQIGHFLKRKGTHAEITRQDIELIRDFYAPDYERFGYLYPSPDAYRNDGKALLRDLSARILAKFLVARQRRQWLK